MSDPNPPHPFVPYSFERRPETEMLDRATTFYEQLDRRRSIRDFSADPVPREFIELAIKSASTAPSGAHRQPWRFVAISDPDIKRDIRLAAEAEERETYGRRMSEEWRQALAPLGTNAEKPFSETVPWIVVLFEEIHGIDTEGNKIKNYYAKESVGLAGGLFIAALHNMGLATLTHTPSPMGFLRDILGRPKNERPFVLFPIGFPAEGAQVPDLSRKPLDEISSWNPRNLPHP